MSTYLRARTVFICKSLDRMHFIIYARGRNFTDKVQFHQQNHFADEGFLRRYLTTKKFFVDKKFRNLLTKILRRIFSGRNFCRRNFRHKGTFIRRFTFGIKLDRHGLV